MRLARGCGAALARRVAGKHEAQHDVLVRSLVKARLSQRKGRDQFRQRQFASAHADRQGLPAAALCGGVEDKAPDEGDQARGGVERDLHLVEEAKPPRQEEPPVVTGNSHLLLPACGAIAVAPATEVFGRGLAHRGQELGGGARDEQVDDRRLLVVC